MSQTISAATARPAHIPESAVYDFDMFLDPAFLTDPHQRVLDLVRTAPPVFWTPRNGGHWMFLSHAANFKASRDTDSFTSQFATREQLDAMRKDAARLAPYSAGDADQPGPARARAVPRAAAAGVFAEGHAGAQGRHPEHPQKFHGGHVIGIDTLWIRWDA